ncbi:serine hydrolase [Nakamurella sp. GG22]
MSAPLDTSVRLSACLVDAQTGEELATLDPHAVRPTASVGKILLLIEVARRLVHRELDPATLFTRTSEDAVADSGLWQHLHTRSLAVADLAVLVGAVSDNLATNVLLREIGLPAVGATAEALGLRDTALYDRVRDHRGPQDPTTLSTGAAQELAELFGRLHRGEIIDPTVSATVLGWLNLDTDMSMTSGAFGLDPLAHGAADRDWWVAHKTGTDTGIRADTGLVRGPLRAVSYAVLAEFDDADRDAALDAMRDWGLRIRHIAG